MYVCMYVCMYIYINTYAFVRNIDSTKTSQGQTKPRAYFTLVRDRPIVAWCKRGKLNSPNKINIAVVLNYSLSSDIYMLAKLISEPTTFKFPMLWQHINSQKATQAGEISPVGLDNVVWSDQTLSELSVTIQTLKQTRRTLHSVLHQQMA